jgi:hypothetical protein
MRPNAGWRGHLFLDKLISWKKSCRSFHLTVKVKRLTGLTINLSARNNGWKYF